MTAVVSIHSNSEDEPVFQKVRPSETVFDSRVNRPPNMSAVRQMMRRGFQQPALGTPELWQRPDEALIPVDGLQRFTLCKQVGFDEPITCKVHRNLSVQQAAALFRLLNLRTKVPVIEDFLKAVTAGDSEATAIDNIIARVGLQVDVAPRAHSVSCIEKLRRVYRGPRGKGPAPEVLERTLRILISAWGFNAEAYHAMLVMGIGTLLHRHPDLDDQSLAVKLRALGTPADLLHRAEFTHSGLGASKPECVAAEAIDAYNKARRTRRLPRWFI